MLTMLYIRSSEVIHLITKTLYPMTDIFSFFLSAIPSNKILWFYELSYFRFEASVRSCKAFVFLVYFTQHDVLQVHPSYCKWQNLLFIFKSLTFICLALLVYYLPIHPP